MPLFIFIFTTFLTSGAHSSPKSCGGALAYEQFRSGVQSLREKPREGWIRRGIPRHEAETVWEHSKKVSQAARILFSRRLALLQEKAVLMAQFHDLGEHGNNPDYTPADNISPDLKRSNEEAALLELFPKMRTSFQDRIISLWREYENGDTLTALLVKDLDKIDAGIQAMVYWQNGYESVEDFFAYTQSKIQDGELAAIYKNLITLLQDGSLKDPYTSYFQLLEQGISLVEESAQNLSVIKN